MTSIFDPEDSALKKAVIVFVWVVIAAMALSFVTIVVKSLPALLFLAAWLVPPAWIYWHAQRIDEQRPILWALLALFVPVVGLVIYLIMHPESMQRCLCPACGGKIEKGFRVCPKCGNDLSTVAWDCPHCTKPVKPEWRYCGYCGGELTRPGGGSTSGKSQ